MHEYNVTVSLSQFCIINSLQPTLETIVLKQSNSQFGLEILLINNKMWDKEKDF